MQTLFPSQQDLSICSSLELHVHPLDLLLSWLSLTETILWAKSALGGVPRAYIVRGWQTIQVNGFEPVSLNSCWFDTVIPARSKNPMWTWLNKSIIQSLQVLIHCSCLTATEKGRKHVFIWKLDFVLLYRFCQCHKHMQSNSITLQARPIHF